MGYHMQKYVMNYILEFNKIKFVALVYFFIWKMSKSQYAIIFCQFEATNQYWRVHK